MSGLNERSAAILREIVDIYSQTGQPVGSKTLAERLPVSLSSATIRNVMAELERQGLLLSPHTSAGRVPSEAGYRYYVNGLLQVEDIDQAIRQRLSASLRQHRTMEEALRDVAQYISQLTSCAGLVMAPRRNDDRLRQLQFVRLGGERVLVVLVMESGHVENRMIDLPATFGDDMLTEAANLLNQQVRGQTLNDAKAQIVETLRQQKVAISTFMDNLTGAGDETALIVGGRHNLFGYPELVREHLQDLFNAFEEKRLLAGLLDRVQEGDGVQIFIGAECPLEVAKDCAMITANYASKDRRIIGTIGVIGPMRMNYNRNIALVDYTARLLSRALDEF